jgi:putative oxidoreductase
VRQLAAAFLLRACSRFTGLSTALLCRASKLAQAKAAASCRTPERLVTLEEHMSAIRTLAPYARSVLRVVVGFTFSLHGMQKLLGFFGGMGGKGATVPFGSLPWFAGGLELIGGLLIILGLFTSPVAFILCGEMAVAYFKAHFPQGFIPLLNHGELAVVYCFVFLYLSIAGAGPLSLDSLVRRKSS